jgi:hypothetical protein
MLFAKTVIRVYLRYITFLTEFGPKLKRQALPSRATLALPSTTNIENIPPRTIIQDLVPVNSVNRPVIVSNPSTSSTCTMHVICQNCY